MKHAYRILNYFFINILQFHGIPWNSPEVPWDSLECRKHSCVTREVPWNSMELEKFHGFPWKFKSSMERGSITKFYGIPWNYERYKELGVTRNSMEYSMKKFHGTLVAPNKISPSSMEFHGTWEHHFHWDVFLDIHGMLNVFHGTLGWPNQMAPSSMEFHGTWWLLYKSTDLWSRYIKYYSVPWNSMEQGWRHIKWQRIP